MDCQKIEELISLYIENELSEELHDEVSAHLEQCEECMLLKEKIVEMLYIFPDLEEDVPFYVKNRIYYIPESQHIEIMPENRFGFLKWLAAAIGTFVLALNLFYFTNIYPPANRLLHSSVVDVKSIAVDAGAFIQKVAESKGMYLLSIFKKEKNSDRDPEFDSYKSDKTIPISKEKSEVKKGEKNERKTNNTN